MTVEEKVGQIIQGDIASITPADMKKYHLGSILNGGSSAPGNDENAPPAKWLALADEFYDASIDTSDGGVGIPMIWGTDAMHGHSNIVGAALFPHNVGPRRHAQSEVVSRHRAGVTAEQVRTTGIDWTFAPTVTVPQDDRWGRAYEGYSEDPGVVASFAGVFVKGLQGDPGRRRTSCKAPHVISSTKHFLADGGTENGRDQGDAKIPETALRDIHNAGYVPAIEAGVQTIMISFSSWNGVKLTGNKGLITDVLKRPHELRRLHRRRLERARPGRRAARTTTARRRSTPASTCTWRRTAGAACTTTRVKQVKDGTIPMERLDDAVTRILRVKFRAGLFEAGPPSKRPLAGDFKMLGRRRSNARSRATPCASRWCCSRTTAACCRSRLTNTCSSPATAPTTSASSRGGWTITWQGTGLNNADFPGAHVRLGRREGGREGRRRQRELSADGTYKKKPDVAIVVFGENPYAEFQGDLKVLTLPGSMTQHLDIMKKLQDENIPVVADPAVGPSAVAEPRAQPRERLRRGVAAGTEGGGISDVLFRKKDGSVNYDFTGKLSFSWPRDAAGAPLNVGQEPYDPLFPLGFGLTYAAPAEARRAVGRSGHSGRAHVDGLVLRQGRGRAAVVAARLATAATRRASPRRRSKPSVAA